MKKMVVITPLSVEPNTFKQVLELPPETMLELIETVSVGAMMSAKLALAPHDKIAIACTMLANANTLLEQCGCQIDTTIKNKTWTQDATYKTEVDGMEGIS
ncbi:MAG: hypothetical protein DRJ03_00740 [Chloroflexi bacterium]|nr:MAG: hypothetical protein DRJ03_00740 [Chloroflexota bacterium]